MGDSEDEGLCVPVRPYDDDSYMMHPERPGPGPAKERKPKVFKPRPPQERKKIEKSLLSATSQAETAQSVLEGALRRQQTDHQSFGGANFGSAVPERFKGMSLQKFGISESGRVASGNVFSSGGGSTTLPRKAKEWKEGKSMELMDLAFTSVRKGADGVIRKNYTPISLPFYNIEDEDQDAGGEDAWMRKKTRPTMKHIDEKNSNAAKELFLNPDGDLQEDNFLLIQLPAILPESLDPADEVLAGDEDATSMGAGTSLSRLPDGLLGKLKIHKSGKVVMEIGGVPFSVDPGSPTFFHQELACVCPVAKEIVNLGPIQNRVVLTPDLTAMFKAAELEETHKAEAAAAEAAEKG